MASIIKQTNPKNGVTYVYFSESYWDKGLKQPRSKRKLVGKIDEATGEIVPTGSRSRPKKQGSPPATDAPAGLAELCRKQAEELLGKEAEIRALKKQVAELNLSLEECRGRLHPKVPI